MNKIIALSNSNLHLLESPNTMIYLFVTLGIVLLACIFVNATNIRKDITFSSVTRLLINCGISFILLGISDKSLLDWISFILVIETSIIVLNNHWDKRGTSLIVSSTLISYVVTYSSYIGYIGTSIESTYAICEYHFKLIENMVIISLIFVILSNLTNQRIATKITIISFDLFLLVNSAVMQIKGISIKLSDMSNIWLALKLSSEYSWRILPCAASAILVTIPIYNILSIKVTQTFVLKKYQNKNYKVHKYYRKITTLVSVFLIVISFSVLDNFSAPEKLAENNIESSNFYENYYGTPFTYYVEHIYNKESKIINYNESLKDLENTDLNDSITKLNGDSSNYLDWTPYGLDPNTLNYNLDLLSKTYDNPDHIVVILNESFNNYPINRLFDTEDSGSITPYFDSIAENTIKGYMYTPAYMGGTANTEYECLTGLSLSVYSTSIYPFQYLITEDNTFSLAQIASKSGYMTNGVHSYYGSGYNRNDAWAKLGITNRYFIESFDENSDTLRGFIVDSEVYDYSIELMNEQEKTFNWLVTMEGHSSDKAITAEEITKYDLNEIEYSSDIIDNDRLMVLQNQDREFYEYLQELQSRDDKVLIIMYGDHQSIWWNSEELDTPNNEQLKRSVTPFCIWANYNIPEQNNLVISSFYMPAIISKLANLEVPEYYTWLLDLYKEYPIINSRGCINSNNEYIPFKELKANTEVINTLHIIQQAALDNKDTKLLK